MIDLFGGNTTVIALVVLVMLSAGGLAYALLYGRISGDAAAARRREIIEDRTTPAAVKAKTAADPARRRKSVQDTLREMEEKERAKAKRRTSPPLNMRLTQAGLSWTRNTFFLISLAIGLFGTVVPYFLGLPIWAAAAFGLAGAFGLPMWIVNFLRKRRLKKFTKEFPNAVDVVVRGVKAGLPLNDCLRIIANEAAEPVRTEFRNIHESQTMGLTVSEAVARMTERVPVPEANFFAIVIAIQQRAGGNLGEALGNLSKVLRERAKMTGKIKAMSMEAKASAWIIGALPVIVMALVYVSSPDYIMLLFNDQLGNVILGAAAIWAFCGVMVMRKMINFDF
jgi:tight adherence protein B